MTGVHFHEPAKDTVLSVQDNQILEVPLATWMEGLSRVPKLGKTRLRFMSELHHQVRNFVVQELPHTGKALHPEFIAKRLALSMAQTRSILDELEAHLFFLVRDIHGMVSWAFPVSVQNTPHQLIFHTGERLYGACAEDAVATPYVLGQLRREYLQVEIRTICGHCNQQLLIQADSTGQFQVAEAGAAPLVFLPDIDWATFNEPTILDAY